MFKSRGRKIIRDVWSRKGRTALASLAIFIGVLGVVTLVSMGDVITRQLHQDLQKDHMSMQIVMVTTPGGAELDNAAYLETLATYPGVMHVEGRSASPLSWKRAGDDKFRTSFLLANWEPFGEIQLEPMRLTSQGRYPVAGNNEVAVEKRMADKYGLDVGDELDLRVLHSGAPQQESWTVVGIVLQSYVNPFSDNENSVFVTFQDAQYIAGMAALSEFHVRYTDFSTAEAQGDNFLAFVAQETAYVPVFTLIDDPDNSFVITVVGQVINVLNLLGLIAMVVSGFLILNIINAVVVEQRRQIGVMKSLGATRLDNFAMYIGLALAYGVIGMVPGVLLGTLIGALMAQALSSLAMTLVEGIHISPMGIIMGAVMGLAVPFAAAIIPVFFGTRVSILQAMTDLGIATNYGKGFLSRILNKLPLPINVRQALSNVTRKKARLALTGLTLTLAVAAFMGIFGVFFSMNTLMADVFDAFGYQVTVSPNGAQDLDEMRALILGENDAVKAVYPGVDVSVELEGFVDPQFGSGQLHVLGFDPATDTFDLEMESGTGWQDNLQREGIVLTLNVAEPLGKKVGDKVVVSAGGQTVELEIIGLVSFPFDQGFMEWRSLARLSGFTIGDEPVPNVFLIQMKDSDPSIAQVDDVIDQISEALLTQGVTGSYQNQVQAAEEASQQVMMFGMMFSLAAAVMAAVGAIGLLSTLSMSVFERQKEIGVMRSIGASSMTIAGQFLVEGILVGVLAWIIGAPLSYLLSKGLMAALPFGTGSLPYPPISLLIGLVGMIVIATFSSLWPSIGAARKTVSEILRYQ
jgi:putative ABC transport system permease protein